MNDLRRRFRRRFAVISTAVTLVVAIGVALVIGHTYSRMLTHIGDIRANEIATAFYGETTRRTGEFLTAARKMPADALRAHPETLRIAEIAKVHIRGTRLMRLAIHDADGRVLFSTAPASIGTHPISRGELDTIRATDAPATSMPVMPSLSSDDAEKERTAYKAAIPIRAADGERIIVTLASDTAGYRTVIVSNLLLSVVAVVGALFAVLGMLIFYVGRDRVLQEQQQKNVALTESVRLAEEASRLKSRFVASMGHELRTPLNAIIGFSEAMKAKVFGPLGSGKYEEYATTIHSSGKHLLAVVDDILDMARIEGGKAVLNETIFSLRAALANCAQVIVSEAERHGLVFACRVPDGLPALRGDEAKIKQIVLNLLANAVRYTPRGGRVSLSAEQRADGSIAIAVTDNGIGIPADQLQSVFEPFRQVENERVKKSGGLGLGLNIAKSFAELHAARLWLESEPGRGTVVCLALPSERLVRAVELSSAA